MLPVPGDLIWIRRQPWRVRAAHAGTTLTRVLVEGPAAAGTRTFLLPVESWAREHPRGTRRVSPGRALAWLAATVARLDSAFTPSSIVDTRTTLFAYQLEPALAVLAGRRRILIADDVGLGKTVQAALIIAETLRHRADARVLVLAPAPLLAQWSDELLDRFGVSSRSADTDTFIRLRAERRYLSNPWQDPGVWIASPDYLKQPHVIDAIPRTSFDLVVIDEAHTMAGQSQRRAAIDPIARVARHVVLLTATPHDGDETRFRRLVSLGTTGSPADALVTFRRTRSGSTRRLRRITARPGSGVSRVLAAIDGFERTRQGTPAAEGRHLICSVFRKRALSSMAAFTASIERRLAVIDGQGSAALMEAWAQPELSFPGVPDGESDQGPADADMMPADEWAVLRGDAGLPPARERAWLQRLRSVAARASAPAHHDSKLARVVSLLRRTREPAVVFTEYRDTLVALAEALTASRRIAVLHGGLGGVEQRQALRAFLEGRADTLVATDVASQGLNLQHRARWVVHFDLPWTPMRLEQRVGRVDRIGQTRPVHVTIAGIRHEADAALRRRVEARQDASVALPLAMCTRWARAADGLARLFARQRALAARWRGSDAVAPPRAQVPAQLIRRLCGAPVSPVTFVEIPIISDTGEVVERHLGWVASAGAWSGSGGPVPPALLRRARALSARAARRLARLRAAQATEAPVALRQPGLFDPRGLTSPHGSTARTTPETAADSDAPGLARVGTPRPVLVLEPRR